MKVCNSKLPESMWVGRRILAADAVFLTRKTRKQITKMSIMIASMMFYVGWMFTTTSNNNEALVVQAFQSISSVRSIQQQIRTMAPASAISTAFVSQNYQSDKSRRMTTANSNNAGQQQQQQQQYRRRQGRGWDPLHMTSISTPTTTSHTLSDWQSHTSTNPDPIEAIQEIMNKCAIDDWDTETMASSSSVHDDHDQDSSSSSSSSSPSSSSSSEQQDEVVAFLFVGQYHGNKFTKLVQEAYKRLRLAATTTSVGGGHKNKNDNDKSCRVSMISVIGGGVIGENEEYDEPSNPCMSLLVGRLPKGASVSTFALSGGGGAPTSFVGHYDDDDEKDFEEGSSSVAGKDGPSEKSKKKKDIVQYWDGIFENDSSSNEKSSENMNPPSFFLVGDPWTPIQKFVQYIHTSSKNAIVAGGISVATGTGPTVALGPEPLPQGSLVGIKFSGTIGFETVVTAQGCRPVGPTYTVTESNSNAVMELNGENAVEVLEGIIRSAKTVEEKRLLSSGLVAGIAKRNARQALDNDANDNDGAADGTGTGIQPDYLMRPVLGFIPGRKGVVVGGGGGKVQVGDIFRFHVRDKETAAHDFDLMVQRTQAEKLFRASFDNNSDSTTTTTKPTAGTTPTSTTTSSSSSTPLVAFQISCIARGQNLFGVPNVDVGKAQELTGGNVPIAGFYANGELGPLGLVAGFSATSASASELDVSDDPPHETYLHGFSTVVAMLSERHSTHNEDPSIAMHVENHIPANTHMDTDESHPDSTSTSADSNIVDADHAWE